MWLDLMVDLLRAAVLLAIAALCGVFAAAGAAWIFRGML